MRVCKHANLRAAAVAVSAGGGVLALSVPRPPPRASVLPPRSSAPLFTFGVIADVQWADLDDGHNYDRTEVRHYRGAFRTLSRAVDWWLALPKAPSFIAQLGDVIDGVNGGLGQSTSAIEAALAELRRAPCPSVNILGNHELYNFDRKALAAASWLRHGDEEFYSFAPVAGWRVVVLDPYQISLIGHAQDDPRRQLAVELIGRRNPGVDPSGVGGAWFEGVKGYDRRFVPYNGGFGQRQISWLRDQLTSASAADERVIVLCHTILEPRACGGSTLAWDYQEALAAIASDEAGSCVAAVLCGHDHSGQYDCDEAGVHHCTFCSPLNKGDEGFAFGVVLAWPDAIEIRSPRMDDVLPSMRSGKPTGRPTVHQIAADALSGECESVRLLLRATTGGIK